MYRLLVKSAISNSSDLKKIVTLVSVQALSFNESTAKRFHEAAMTNTLTPLRMLICAGHSA